MNADDCPHCATKVRLRAELAEAHRRDRYHLALLGAYSQLLGDLEDYHEDPGEDLWAAVKRFHQRKREIKDEHKAEQN